MTVSYIPTVYEETENTFLNIQQMFDGSVVNEVKIGGSDSEVARRKRSIDNGDNSEILSRTRRAAEEGTPMPAGQSFFSAGLVLDDVETTTVVTDDVDTTTA
ncbi:uncharacterized protein LOC143030539 [Oratosquilla oratoria]|uniref:uncharacterized protein LOC143030539 n=1 Tax=Oratosquilla oratoria TaxID=337810 RepID=UPI003F76534C